MMNFVKGMDKTGRGFEYLRNKFPNVSDAKFKEGIFIGPPDQGTDARQTFQLSFKLVVPCILIQYE